ncbi:MAG: DNA polymerase ligase N-terminal domain-containing protein [Planctomycetota bacterium]
MTEEPVSHDKNGVNPLKKRFVIQQHFLSSDKYHFDLMFEENNVLRTFQIDRIDNLLEGVKVLGKNIQDHRLIYLDYEGEISGNRGYVKIFDKGYYQVNKKTDNLFELLLEGAKIPKSIIEIKLIDIEQKIFEIILKKFL